MGDLTLFIPETVVLAGALLAFALSVSGVAYRVNRGVSIVAAIAALVVTILFLDARGEPFFEKIYAVDPFSQVLKLGVVAGLLLTLLAASTPLSFRSRVRADTPLFLFFSALGMMMRRWRIHTCGA